MTSRSSGPQYAQLAQSLITRIEQGQLRVGDKLPTEELMCQQFGVSRITVRSALSELERRGLVLRRPRLGTTVISDRTQGGFVQAGDSIQDILSFTQVLPFVLLDHEEIALSADAATAARLQRGLHVLRVTGLRKAPGAPPVIYGTHLIPALWAPSGPAFDGLRESIPEWVARQRGEEVHEIEQAIDVTRLGAKAARALEARTGSPALRTRRWYRLRNGDVLAMSEGLSPEGRHSIVSVLHRKHLD